MNFKSDIEPIISKINAKIKKHSTYISNLQECLSRYNGDNENDYKKRCDIAQNIQDHNEFMNDLKQVLHSLGCLKYES